VAAAAFLDRPRFARPTRPLQWRELSPDSATNVAATFRSRQSPWRFSADAAHWVFGS
jgi:hypothetical protein